MGKICSHEYSYPARLTFRRVGERKSFPDKQKLREFMTTKPALHEILQGALKVERKDEKSQYEGRKHKSNKN